MLRNDLIDRFLTISGRRDFDNNQVIEYLNQGQRYLDDTVDFGDLYASHVKKINAGTYLYILDSEIHRLEFVKLISLTDNQKVIELNLIPYNDIVALQRVDIPVSSQLYTQLNGYAFPNAPTTTLISQRPSAVPTFFSLASLRRVPSADLVDSDTSPYTGQLAFIETGVSEAKNGIIFDCPTDQDYLLEIYSQFYSIPFQPFIDDATVGNTGTYWSIRYPEILLHAAMLKLEIMYRNSEGAKDWLNAINMATIEMHYNSYEQETLNTNKMEG